MAKELAKFSFILTVLYALTAAARGKAVLL